MPTYPIARGAEIEDEKAARIMAQGELVEMPPETFLALTPAPDWWTGHSAGFERVKERLREGKPVDAPYIHLWYKKMHHEGRHRALAAQELGFEAIPVAVLKETPTEAELAAIELLAE